MTAHTAVFAVAISAALSLPLTLGCGKPAPRPAAAPNPAVSELDADDPTLLARPFTAEQIRDEWVEGLRLVIRRRSPSGEAMERWTVVAADEAGVEIESAPLDENLEVAGEPTVVRSGWIELRNHASFPADSSHREWTERATALGVLEGWLYTVSDREADTVSELFFAAVLPGAPVQMTVRRGEETIVEFEQLERVRP